MERIMLLLLLLTCLNRVQAQQQQQQQQEATPLQLNYTESAPAPLHAEPGMWRQARRRSTLVDSCSTNAGATGTCLTRFKCMRQGGTVNGYCGTYGVCCESESESAFLYSN